MRDYLSGRGSSTFKTKKVVVYGCSLCLLWISKFRFIKLKFIVLNAEENHTFFPKIIFANHLHMKTIFSSILLYTYIHYAKHKSIDGFYGVESLFHVETKNKNKKTWI